MIAKVRTTILVLVVGACLGCSPQGQAPTASPSPTQAREVLVLRGGLLIDGTGGAPRQNPVIMIVDGKIQSVSREGSDSIPANATVIDTSGKTIIPGLVDSHVHLQNMIAPLFLYWGVTTIGDLGNVNSWILAERDAIEDGRALGPSILAVGSMFNTPLQPQTLLAPGDRREFETFLTGNPFQTYVTDEASIEAAFAEAKKLGIDGIKLFQRMPPSLMKIAADEGHRNGWPVFAHFSTGASRVGLQTATDEILDTGIDVHVHTYGIELATVSKSIRDRIGKGELNEADYLMDTSKFPALAQSLIDRGIRLNPTIGARWGKISKYRDEFHRLNISFLEGPLGSILSDVSRRRYANTFTPYSGQALDHAQEGYRKMGQFVKEFADRGGIILAGADTGSSRTPGISIHVEMQMLSEIGVKPMQIIQAATSWSMDAWRKSNEAGTIEPEKRADIVVLNRNPLEDISATRDIHLVIKAGKLVDRDALVNWKDPVVRPVPVESGTPNSLIHVPFIYSISPESAAVTVKNRTQLMINGQNFTPESLVLFNDRLIPAKFYDETRLGIVLEADFWESPGTYPLVVVRPGSGGATSNLVYFIVNPDQ